MKEVQKLRKISPVLPVLSRKHMEVPFLSSAEMLEFNRERGLPLWELAVLYESQRSGKTAKAVYENMKVLAGHMEDAVARGIKGNRLY